MDNLIIVNFNAARCGNSDKVRHLANVVEAYLPSIVCIQEINVRSALKEFSSRYQVFINLESDSRDGVGMVSLVKLGIKVDDVIVGYNGRIIGVKCGNMQICNVYPKSGSACKKERECFFFRKI